MKATRTGLLTTNNKYRILVGSISLLFVSIFLAYLIKEGGVKIGVLILVALIAPLFAYSVIAYPEFGIISILILSYFIMFFLRLNLTTFPLGTVMDLMQALLILGVFIKQKYQPDWQFLKTPISILIIIWICYNFLEVINPSAESRTAWIYTIRSLAIVMFTYFVFSYQIRSIKFVRLLIKLWIGLSLIGALYGFKQQHFGFFGFEEAYLYSDPIIMDLLFINGTWRKFSIFSDPVIFSYLMIITSLLCIGLLYRPMRWQKKLVIILLILFFVSNMLYSGTRSAYILLPAAFLMLVVLKLTVRILIVTIIGSMILGILIFIPTGNPTLYRFQSAFKPTSDASFNVRAINQKRIQPYIQTHPMGGGLGSTGVWGAKYSPNSFLAAFPPDSGYVRVAVEMGWIGLLIFCTLMFVILKTGIEVYYKIRDPELKSYCLAMVLVVYALAIGNYPQEALVQYPINILFYLVAALINVLYKLDLEKLADSRFDNSTSGVIDK